MKISIIISALNEPFIYRTLDGLVNSDKNIDEIIVIDDNSDEPIKYENKLVKIFRNSKREGLIRSRNLATTLSKNEYVISIDAHCKVSDNWATDLAEAVDDYRTITVPTTTGLNVDTWTQNSSVSHRIGIKWDLDFYWRDVIETDFTPMICGHCFCFTREWFLESGGFDTEMDKWGGENLELSIKTWLCGGSIKIAKKSRVAHYFKSKWTYEMDGKTLLRNKARVAEVWLDDYKDNFYSSIGYRNIQYGDISERLKLKRLQQRNFGWFIEKLQPELAFEKFKLKHQGRTFAIIGSAPSLDHINLDVLKSFDVIIGVNYNSFKVHADYVLFHDLKPALKVLESGRYNPEQLMVPVCLKSGKTKVYSQDLDNRWSIYYLGPQDSDKTLKRKSAPFFNHASSVQTAAHIAAFMGAKSVTLVGCDFKVSGNSHCSLPEYRGGNYWPNNAETDSYLRRVQQGNDMLNLAFKNWRIPLLRYGTL